MSQTCDIFLWQTRITGITDNKTIGLPSPDGSQDGKWYFPNSVVTRIVTQGKEAAAAASLTQGINGFKTLQPRWTFQPLAKVINSKYSKHWVYTVAHRIDCVCSKMLNHGLIHGLNHGLFLSSFSRLYIDL